MPNSVRVHHAAAARWAREARVLLLEQQAVWKLQHTVDGHSKDDEHKPDNLQRQHHRGDAAAQERKRGGRRHEKVGKDQQTGRLARVDVRAIAVPAREEADAERAPVELLVASVLMVRPRLVDRKHPPSPNEEADQQRRRDRQIRYGLERHVTEATRGDRDVRRRRHRDPNVDRNVVEHARHH